jgi:hypothetical protein
VPMRNAAKAAAAAQITRFITLRYWFMGEA